MTEAIVRPWWVTPWPTSAQAHLLQAIFGRDDRAVHEYHAWLASIDLDAQVDIGTYRLLPLLAVRLRALDFTDDLTARWRGVYKRAWFGNNLLFGDVAPALRALADAGLPALLLKGAPLGRLVYPEHAARPMADIDLLVRQADLHEAIKVISALPGWRRKYEVLPDIERLYRHSTTFIGARHEIDLHWHALTEARSSAADAWFWQDARAFAFGDLAALCPAPTQLLLSIIVHGMRCNPASPIRWIADAVLLIRADPQAIDWPGLVAFAARERLTHRLGLGLDYLRRMFELPIPAEVPANLLARPRAMVERIENLIYLADPATTSEHSSRGERLRTQFANYVIALGTRHGGTLAAKLLGGARHFPAYRQNYRDFYRRRNAGR